MSYTNSPVISSTNEHDSHAHPNSPHPIYPDHPESSHPQKYHFIDAARKVLLNIKSQKESESYAHLKLRTFIPPQDGPVALASGLPGFVNLSQTGVIYVTERASQQGFKPGHPEWANFGQGAPEVTNFPGSLPKPSTIELNEENYEYAPVTGLLALREKVANLYNDLYRQGKTSKYTAANVCIVPGGRAGLTRVAASFGDVNVGFFLPEYTAYEEMLYVFKRVVPIPSSREKCMSDVSNLKNELNERGIRVVVTSNPCNPTGQVIRGEELKKWIEASRESQTTLVMDEFYSHYIYDNPENKETNTVSCAEYIDDVEKDPVVILDGLTKNWRCPGWRICWVVGPSVLVGTLRSAGSFLEGGANSPLQHAALPLLDPIRVRTEAKALQEHFRNKRDYVVGRLRAMGIRVDTPPPSTFYIWAYLGDLPPPLENGLSFFEEALKEKVIVVPGIFFDINPGRRRELFHSPCHNYIRLSFGPPLAQLEIGLNSIQRLIEERRALFNKQHNIQK
eukprot:TRINITY_DN2115_c0_g3_i1.p1 TRINITY_DN2115_c0_g3~~TRINITY_DN2115_c0_g3_i1.p1  ORF type:complete len:507 (-),score=109.91 TRINITY_DN2115_c0_g3_i1:44-1564(-)